MEQLLARGGAKANLTGQWQNFKKLLVAALNIESPPEGSPPTATAQPDAELVDAPVELAAPADAQMDQGDNSEDDEEDDAAQTSSSERRRRRRRRRQCDSASLSFAAQTTRSRVACM